MYTHSICIVGISYLRISISLFIYIYIQHIGTYTCLCLPASAPPWAPCGRPQAPLRAPPGPPCGRPQAPLLLGRGGGWLGSPVPNSRGVVGGWLEQGCTPQTLPDSCLSCNVQHRYWVAPDHATQFCVTYFFHFYTRRRKTKYFEKFKCSFYLVNDKLNFTKTTILQNRRFYKIDDFVKSSFL